MCAGDKVLTLYHGSKAGLEGPIGLKSGRNRRSRPPEHLFWTGYLYRYWHCLTGETSAAIHATADYRRMAGAYAGYHTLSCELAIENLKEDAKAA